MVEQSPEITERLEQLRVAHHEADLRLRELDRHLSLTPEEQVEVARLKKHKLQLKDEIRQLSSSTNSQ